MRRSPALVSVIVPARGASRTLARQLDAIAGQDHSGPLEIVVAVNGCAATRAAAERWIGERGIGRVVDASARRGPGYARNLAVADARGDFLAFCDADDVVSSGWLRALATEAQIADLVTGPHETDLLNSEVVRACQSVPHPGKRFLAFLPMASTSNCGVWKDVFEALGGFEELRRTAGEDISFSWRAQLAGYRLSVAEEAVVQKRFRRTRLGIGPQYFWFGTGDAWLYSRFRSAGMPRRPVREALREWGHVAKGLPSHAGQPGRWGRVLQLASLACGRTAGSVRNRALYL